MATTPAASFPQEPDLPKGEVIGDTTEQKKPNGFGPVVVSHPGPPTIIAVGKLATNPEMLHDVVTVINTAFAIHRKFRERDRFQNDQQLVDQFGADALCSVLRPMNRVIATASIKRWRPPECCAVDNAFKTDRPEDYHLLAEGRSYEVKAVATLPESAFQRKGLATQCIEVLQDAILTRHKGGDVLLWIHTAEDQNGAYWRRRGFEPVLTEIMPKGHWGRSVEFPVTTLVKRAS